MLDLYNSLLGQNWTMKAIDEMDIFYYFDILTYKIKIEKNKQEGNTLKGLPEDD
ncbi:TPA: hypothetical protein N2D04_002531 [Clostridium botulinum]|nr:hypothetical protein [Clostridium botulinum]HCL4458417.1 hypothetical protein [Clostridium botulinum]HCL4462329.1 hypothetical protein [Clostridium botulinum]HCL4473388.1 hypothetical protein [Clostridium botulinum]HCL4476979.1 hypothetical protein [Clostridium botulinum]